MTLHLDIPRKKYESQLKYELSKLRYEGKNFSQTDLEKLSTLVLEISLINFPEIRWKRLVYKISLIKEFISKIKPGLTFKESTKLWWSFPRVAEDLIYNSRSYYGIKFSKDCPKYSLKRKLRKDIKIAPQRFIGVGYKDKGTCANVSFDGSPSWKEVCTSEQIRENENYSQLIDFWREPPEVFSLEDLFKVQRKGFQRN